MAYMHSLVYDIPKFMEMYQTVGVFTGQGVGKNNDVARSVVLLKSNNNSPGAGCIKGV